MQSSTEKKLIIYTALFTALLLNVFKLSVLVRNNGLLAQYWHFNGYELLFEFIWNFLFCLALVYMNLRIIATVPKLALQILLFIFCNLFLAGFANRVGIRIQRYFFLNDMPERILRLGHGIRVLASVVLMGILVKVILLLREKQAKDIAHEQLRNAYLNAQLELLKEELNPHFFFNALSSLSAIVRENPKQAQVYINHLSKIFRHSLHRNEQHLIPLRDELAAFHSYTALLQMRLEAGLQVSIAVAPAYMDYKLPYMSLQPLLENATKHNAASPERPLHVYISVADDTLVVENNLQPDIIA
ncbi:putative regulator of cell autolysis [Russula earlei]|uniref:Regulator of cell autolysis n=1 Tax=Russula earlei TaxID=71964 RepID=A0ACC0TS22_9AGAM|nr:putative regulator of cell autolysis [Russula earlei]